LLALLPLLKIKNSLFVVMVVRVGKISISVSISKKNGKYRVNIVSNEKAGIAPTQCPNLASQGLLPALGLK
jgi:hypothetical protein